MPAYRKSVIRLSINDEIQPGTRRLFYRAWQRVNKDGTDSKMGAAMTQSCLVVYPDGSRRFFGRDGRLKYEKLTAARLRAEKTG